MKFAVIRVSGKQFKVAEGDIIDVAKTDSADCDVLMVVNDDKVDIGTPTVKGAKVQLEILEQFKGVKLDIYKFKAKSRYRKHTGFRPQLTKIKVVSIK
ncbi:MAG: 50S ribosomal protein L21 [bacterium]|nr:50S ribosomal protein L21 [bacterium]